jgi:anti-sigma regulatory factor (Ser/Thr protein kinase)
LIEREDGHPGNILNSVARRFRGFQTQSSSALSSSRSFHHAARLLAKAGHAVAGSAGPNAEVHASWFDAIPLDGGDVALIVGRDHGATAAQRAAVRDLCFAAAAPSESVATLAVRGGGARAVARFDPRTRRLTYATTGDAAALLAVADGPTALLPPGHVDGRPTDRVLTLPPRAVIALSTQPPAAEEVLVGHGICDQTSAAAIVSRIAEHADAARDVSLALTAGTDPPHRFACALPAVPVTAPFVRASMRAFAHASGLDTDRLFALQTAVGEAVANSIEHAYGPSVEGGVVRVSAQRGSGDLTVWIEDDGQWRLDGDPSETRGRGLPLMRALVDAVDIVSDGRSTTVRLTLLLDG